VTEEHYAHMNRIATKVDADIRQKYLKGQVEHGGKLWLKPAMLKHIREEILDLVVYQETAAEQIRGIVRLLQLSIANADWTFVDEAVDKLIALEDGETD
jgi:hypothetical protein